MIHWTFGSISMVVLVQLLLGGIPGVIVGCVLSRQLPAQKLKAVVAGIAICAGLQLVWTGARALVLKNPANAANIPTRIEGTARP